MAANQPKPLRPGATIGILGGGQLGRMLAIAAARLGFGVLVYDPDEECPAAQVSNGVVTGAFDDDAALTDFAAKCARVTYEFENIPLSAVDSVSSAAYVFPERLALEMSQDRLLEKRFIAGLGISTAPFFDIDGPQSLAGALDECGDAILKTRRFGYDGKGQVRITSKRELPGAAVDLLNQPCILEALVNFGLEISVVAARGIDGEFAAFDPAWNRHEQGILRVSTVPAPVDEPVRSQAVEITRIIMEALDYVGVIGVEFFVTGGGALLVNEFAPRVHNSGHWTEAACAISQFENHIRAVAGLPLGATKRHSDCEMINLIGDEVDEIERWLDTPDCLVHLYGKRETRPGRKMGHVTRLIRQGLFSAEGENRGRM